MKYYEVEATNISDGSPHPFRGDHVSEWSLKSLRPFFESYGVELHATYTYSINDRPVFVKDDITGEIRPNRGEVL